MIDLSKTDKKTDNEYFPPQRTKYNDIFGKGWVAPQTSYKGTMIESMTH